MFSQDVNMYHSTKVLNIRIRIVYLLSVSGEADQAEVWYVPPEVSKLVE